MTNTGKPYEALTEQVFRRLLGQEEICVNVQRDTIIQGKSTTHQIDVSFDFKVGQTKYLTVVQCKDWASPVKQEQVLTFVAVLQDIPGQPRGIMVARSGFQDGAREVARHHGIQLYELRDPKDEDWNGLFRHIVINLEVQQPEYRKITPCLDEAWLRQELALLGITAELVNLRVEQDPYAVDLESGGHCDLRDPFGEHMGSFTEQWTPIRHEFSDALMFNVTGGPIPRLRCLAVTAEARLTLLRKTITVSADHFVAYCFRDVLDGTFRFLDKDGNSISGADAKEGEQ